MNRLPILQLVLLPLFAMGYLYSQVPYTISSSGQLADIFSAAVDSVHLILEPGTYEMEPVSIIDSTCGNCEDPNTPVVTTTGLHIRGRFVRISGPTEGTSVLITNAGYGIFVEHSDSVIIENVTVTGGTKSQDPNATDAAIVVKNSGALIRNNEIIGNIGDTESVRKTITGIIGIAGREGSFIHITGNRIVRNSWDGIALYKGSSARITHNRIDGIDKATGDIIGGGRGVGIGITWNARAHIQDNLVSRYWKGIGIFLDASATVQNNIVEDIVTWGVALWDASKGHPTGKISNNIIYSTGACGISITLQGDSAQYGFLTGNIVVKTAQNPKYDDPDYYCYQCALAIQACPDDFVIDNNLFFMNRRASDDLPDFDVSESVFREQIMTRYDILKHLTFFHSSDFYNITGLLKAN
jgi:hypothetical protein